MKSIIVLFLCMAAVGCSNSFTSGGDNIYQLSSRNVAQRDLTQAESLHNPTTVIHFEPLRLAK